MTIRPEGMVIWITGLPASGKSTLAERLLGSLEAQGVVTMWLDSDDLRRVITPKATYALAERDNFYKALGHVAALSAKGGAIVVVSATAPRREHRETVRRLVPSFHEVYLYCAEYIRRARDKKGLYEQQDAGLITTLPGAGMAYEEPPHPELRFDSGVMSPETLMDEMLAYLRGLGSGLTEDLV